MAGEYSPDEDWGNPEQVDPDVTGATRQAQEPQQESYAPGQDWGEPQEHQPEPVQPGQEWGAPKEMTSSAAGAFLRRGVQELPAATAGGVAGVGAGAVAGAGAGLATANPIVGGAAALGAGIPAAIYVGGKTHDFQDWLLDQLGLREGTGFFSRNQEQVDRMQHPYSTFGGELAAALPTFGTGLARTAAGKIASTVPVAGRAVGAGIQGGMEAGREAWEGEDLDPTKIGLATAAGAVLAKPRGWVPGGGSATFNRDVKPEPVSEPQGPSQPLGPEGPGQFRMGAGREVPSTDPVRWPGMNPEEARGNPNRAETPDQIDLGADPNRTREGEIQPPVKNLRESTANERQIQFAAEQRDGFSTGDPMWNFWNEHVMELQNVPAQQKGFQGRDDDARWGPAIEGEYHEVTPEDLSRANDLTTVAVGVAAENPRAPEVRGAGNPVGAPMSTRIAARPTEPARDYSKQKAVEREGQAGTTSGDTHPDLLAALSEDHVPAQAPEAPKAPAQEQPQVRVEPEHLTATVTPVEQARINELKGQFGSLPKVLERVTALPPKVQLQALEAIRAKVEQYRGQSDKAAYDIGARPKTETGMTARSKADAARKQSVLDAYDTAVREHGRAAENEQPGQMMSRLTSMVQRADELMKGNAYRPNDKPASYQLVNAAKKLLSRPSKANMDAFKKAELASVEGDKVLAETNQTEKRIEADIEKRPGVNDTQRDRILDREAEGSTNRIEHETFDNAKGDESQVYKTQHDGLTTYLNSLSDNNWHTLNELHEGKLDSMVRTTQDPQELRHTLLQDLAEAQRKNPPRLELPAEDGPVAKRTPIKDAKGLAASEGRHIDPNSEEGKAIAAAALSKAPKTGLKVEDVQQAERRAYGADLPKDPDAPASRPIDGSSQSLAEHWARMMADEGGAVNPNQIARDLAQWMKTAGKAVTDYWSPQVPAAIIDYGKQIGMAGTKLNTQLTRLRQRALAGARAAVRPDGKPPLPAEFDRMLQNHEDRVAHSPDDQTYWDAHVKPWLDMAARDYRELKDTSERLQLPGWAKMTEPHDNGQGYKDYMHRRMRKTEDDDAFNPVLNRSLSNWAASGQARDWFALQDNNGSRRIYRVNDDGKMVFYNNRRAGSAKTPPAGFNPQQVGENLTMAGNRTWKVDNATVRELEAHGAGERGKPLQFVHNPVITAIDAAVGLRSALARVRLLESILTDPQFAQLNTRKEAEAESRWGKGNFTKTDLPQMKDRYMPKAMAWAFDDIVKQGFHYGDDSAFARLAQVSQTLLKPFYMLGPEVHVFNELDKFISQSPVLGKQLPKMPQHLRDAVSSVWHQDALQAEIMDNGGNPMYGHAAVARLMPQIGKAVGEDMSLRPWKYDPLMEAFGTNSRDALDHLYQQSNKVMWWQSDVLYTAMYKAFKAQGLNPREAVHETEKIIDSYVVPTTFGKTAGLGAEYGGLRADIGRRMQQFLTDPLTSNFGRFSYGLVKTSASMVKNMLGPSSTPMQRAAGAAQMAMVFVAMPLLYQGLSHLYGMITGNEHSELEQRGVTRMLNTPFAIAKGEKAANAISQRVWSPSVPIETGLRLWDGKDFAGRRIWDTPGHLTEFLAGQAVSPVRSLSAGLEQGGAGFGAQRFVESNFGLKTPSPNAIKYQQGAGRRAIQEDRRNNARPRGALDRGVNWLVRGGG